jgi:uncharacterized membrane protein
MPKQAPREIRRQLVKWGHQAIILRAVNVILGVTATVASVLVAAKINSFDKTTIEWLAVAAAAAAGLLTALDTGPKANRMRSAWRRLNAAVIMFESDGDLTIEQLVSEYSEAESMIGDVQIKTK